MRVDVGLCQYEAVPGDPSANAGTVLRCLDEVEADVLVFPEMFLVGYGTPCDGIRDDVEACVGEISDKCRMLDKAVAIGAPRYELDMTYNSLLFLSPDGDTYCDKTHLARFGIYSEEGFAPGYSPGIGSYHGMLFGMCVCYDIFFPEILHGCSLAGSSVNICAAASAVQSKPFLDRILPARALENVTYTAYSNNIGPANGLDMHGCSRGLDPYGDVIADCGTEAGVSVFTADTDKLAEAREVRRHLEDFRRDIDWGIQSF